jgi:hypothetical protein
MNHSIIKGKLSVYKNNPKINPAKIKYSIAATESGPDEKMIETIMMKAEEAARLPRSIQIANHNRKRMGRYIPPHDFRDSIIAISIVRATKTNKIKNKAISAENSVE